MAQNCTSTAASMSDNEMRPETIAAQVLHGVDRETGAVVPPLHMATTYARDENYERKTRDDYQRGGHPALWQAEAALAKLEHGSDAKLFASGMAAATAVLDTVPVGGRVIAPMIMYYAIRAWLQRLEQLGRIRLDFYDPRLPHALLAETSKGAADLVWVETPSNPTWDVTSIEEAARLAHGSGAELVVDATVLGAVTTHPLDLGADIVFHSATKYLNGHSDVLAGLLVTKVLNPRWELLQMLRTRLGAPLPPYEAWLLMRGLRTLFVRYRQASDNALAIAQHFEKHPRIERVLYPGLATHPGHDIARREMQRGYSGMLSLLVKGGFDEAKAFCTRLQLIIPATSLGGVESLAEHRKTVEGPESPVPDNLVRMSIGIEHVDDLIADIAQALR